MQVLLQDLRYGIRVLLKKSAFTLIAVITLALGIGVNTAIFSLVNAVLLKSLPVKEPEQLVQFKWLAGPGFGNKHHKEYFYAGNSRADETTGLRLHTSFPRRTFEEFSKQQEVFTKLFAFSELEQVNANVDGQAEVADGLVVSGGYFTGLGVRPWLGRTVTEEDDRSSSPPVVVLSFHYWQRRFGENPAVIGKQINLNNAAFTIIGITPPEFAGTMGRGKAPDLIIPLAMEPLVRGKNSRLNWGLWWLLIMGRLNPGVTEERVRAQFEPTFQHTIAENIRDLSQSEGATTVPRDYRRLVIAPGRRGDTDWGWHQRQSLYLLMTVVGLVLLIACTNMANMLLAHAVERQNRRISETQLKLKAGITSFKSG